MAITVSGTTITFNDATTQTTGFANPIPVANGGTGGTTQATARSGIGAGTGNGNGNGNGNGTVTSVATGNGLSGGTITSTGTLVIACPSYNSVGSYVFASNSGEPTPTTAGQTFSAGSGSNQLRSFGITNSSFDYAYRNNDLSGSWRWMATSMPNGSGPFGIACRIS
jgi:hypothetical protein